MPASPSSAELRETLASLRVHAMHVLRTTCRGSSWIGLEVSDLVAEGWLALVLGQHPHHAMRRAAMAWHGGVRLVQTERPVDRACDSPPDADEACREAPTLDARALLERLSPRRRGVIEAIYRDGLTVAETAARLALTSAEVYRARYRAIEQLRTWAGRPSAATLREQARQQAWQRANPDRVRASHAKSNKRPERMEALRLHMRRYHARRKLEQGAPMQDAA